MRLVIRLLWAVFGGTCLLVLGTVIAAIPVGNLYVMGCLLEGQGRRADRTRSGDASFIALSAQAGRVLFGCGLWLLPLGLLAWIAADARMTAPGSGFARGLVAGLVVLAVISTAHLWLAIMRGGRLNYFLRPVGNLRWMREQLAAGRFWQEANDRIHRAIDAAAIGRRLWVGARGFAGTLVWLAGPMALLAFFWQPEGVADGVLWLAGAGLVVLVLAWLPLLQARFAVENRFAAMFALRPARELFRHAPIAWTLSIIATYALSIPFYFYLLHVKMRVPPHDGRWDLALIIFVGALLSRIMLGYAHRRALRRAAARWFVVWPCRAVLIVALGFYVWLLSHTPQLGDHGHWSLFEPHALVMPFRL